MHVIHINLQDGWRGGELQVSFLMEASWKY